MKIRILKERKLTDAEKSKREKIAKAIEKESPKMPMDKKMAIATAQAKKNEEQLEEITAMASGAVAGATGVAGDPDEVRKFNEDEKKQSKLDGTPLEEMYSTAAFPGDGHLYVDDDENEGRLERWEHQGLQNIKESKLTFHQRWKKFLKA